MCARDCKCFLKWWTLLNFAPHSSHVNGASPVWILIWLSLFCFVPKDFLQMSHAKFLIPWQEILWWCKTFLCLNLAPQLKHLFIRNRSAIQIQHCVIHFWTYSNFLSPWDKVWLEYRFFVENLFPQISQKCGLISWWIFICSFRVKLFLNLLLQKWQANVKVWCTISTCFLRATWVKKCDVQSCTGL